MSTERTPRTLQIGPRSVGDGFPTFIIAELSANHGQNLDDALALIRAAADAGADAVKTQTYTADTLTIDSDEPPFLIGEGTPWSGRRLHDLYTEASTPWEWYPELLDAAEQAGIILFSTPFDRTATDFLARFDTPVFKIASFELIDIPLIRDVARRGMPLIMSTGMATRDEIDEAVTAALDAGAPGIALLRCNSAYPAPPNDMDLVTITDMVARWPVVVGLSDHTLGTAAAVAAVALGARVVEKHLTLSREVPGPDASFSLEPDEFRLMVDSIREAEAAVGSVRYGPTGAEQASLVFRRSLFVVEDIAEGERITESNVRSIRPGHGLAPKHLPEVIGRVAARRLGRGTPLQWADLTPTAAN